MNKLLRDRDIIRWQAQTKLADLTSELSQEHLSDGFTSDEKEDQGLSIVRLLEALDQYPHLTDEEIENLLYCIMEVSEIRSILPALPSVVPIDKPDIAQGIAGAIGPGGPTGPPGSDNVIVSPDPAFDNIKVTAVVAGGITDYQLGYDPYIATIASMVINSGTYYEIGANNTVNFTASYVLGREAVTSTLITTPSGFTWTTNPQVFADSNLIILSRTNRDYTAQVDDDTTVDSDIKTVTFLFPLFYGSDDIVLTGLQVYSNLNKLVQDITLAWEIVLSFTDDYGYFAFDSAYDDSSIIIRDQNGFDVTDEWDFTLVDVDSGTTHAGGGGTDWTKEYKVWRTKLKTDINGTYTIENVTPS